VDTRKAYTSDFMDIDMYPVFDYFDIWKIYDNHKIEDYNQYLVLGKSAKPEHLILSPELVTRVTGYKLNRIPLKQRENYTVLSFKRPSKLVNSNARDLINALWATKISDNDMEDSQSKKDIFNIISGLLEKKYNKKSLTKIFKNYDEAFYYQTTFGGEIYTMAKEGCGDILNSKVFGKQEENQSYLLQKQVKVELVNGFTPIKEMIYIRSLKNYRIYMKLKENGIQGLGIKTDSILVDKKHEKLVKTLFNFTDKIGNFKLEHNKNLSGDVIIKILNKMPVIDEIVVKTHVINNERDIKEINDVVNKCENLLLLGNLSGLEKQLQHVTINVNKSYLSVHKINYVKH
jgi:hypothetical protein